MKPFAMRIFAWSVSAAIMFCPALPAAQATSTDWLAAAASAHAAVAADLQAAAEKMPEERYSYRPSPDVRSFGQIVAHVAGGQFLYCSQGGGGRIPPEVMKTLVEIRPFSDVATERGARAYGKADLLPFLAASTKFCQSAYSAASAADAKAVRALIGNVAHDNEHYGNLVTYLRLNGLVPPSTERAGTTHQVR